MQNTIQKFSTRNQNYLLSSLTPAKPLTSENNKKEDGQKYFNNSALIGSLTGLAIIGGGTAAIISGHIAGFKNMTGIGENINQSANVILEKISKLKKLVTEDYILRRTRIIQDLNKFGEFDYKLPFKNGKDLRTKITKLEEEYSEIDAIYKNNVQENSTIIKDKIRNLSTDSEWKELRKLRKQFMKTMQNSSAGEQRRIASEKITFINDLLITKVYPQDAAKYNLYGITEKQALELVRKEFNSYKEFTEYYDSIKDLSIPFRFEEIGNRFSHNGSLSLADIFPEETGAIKNSAKLREDTFSKLEAARNLYKTYLKKLEQLAKEYRQTSGIIELRTLWNSLKTLQTK